MTTFTITAITMTTRIDSNKIISQVVKNCAKIKEYGRLIETTNESGLDLTKYRFCQMRTHGKQKSKSSSGSGCAVSADILCLYQTGKRDSR